MTTGNLTPVDAIRLARDKDVKIVDLKFTDVPGTIQHFSIPVHGLTEELFDEGLGFDGSSVRAISADP